MGGVITTVTAKGIHHIILSWARFQTRHRLAEMSKPRIASFIVTLKGFVILWRKYPMHADHPIIEDYRCGRQVRRDSSRRVRDTG